MATQIYRNDLPMLVPVCFSENILFWVAYLMMQGSSDALRGRHELLQVFAWQFLELEAQTIIIDLEEYFVYNLPKILGILNPY